MGHANSKIFSPAPWGPREWSKGQIFNINYKVNFKDFYIKLCVRSHKCKIPKHIRWDFHSVDWVMPQGWDLRAVGVPRGSKKIGQHTRFVMLTYA